MAHTFAEAQDEVAARVKLFRTNFPHDHAPATANTTHDREMLQRQTPCPAVSGIDATDRQIDVLVYRWYGLGAEGIRAVGGRG